MKEGDYVNKNEVLARLETQILDCAQDQARQTVKKDNASLIQAEANFRREEALWKDQLVAQAVRF